MKNIVLGVFILLIIVMCTNWSKFIFYRRTSRIPEWESFKDSLPHLDELLNLLADIFSIRRKMKYKIGPNDRILDLYNVDLGPINRLLNFDEMQLEELIHELQERYGIQELDNVLNEKTTVLDLARLLETTTMPGTQDESNH